MSRAKELVLYRDFKESRLFYSFVELMECADAPGDKGEARERYYECLHDLTLLAQNCGFSGNLWHDFLAYLLADNENAYSRACEMKGRAQGSIRELARHDLSFFQKLFAFDLHRLETAYGVFGVDLILNFTCSDGTGREFSHRVQSGICKLGECLADAGDIGDFQDILETFYLEFGVGTLGLHKAFRIAHTKKGARIVPIANIAHAKLEDLIGYEIAKEKLVENTEAFLCGRGANNCLLFGDAGTGKSTSIKAIANRYYEKGLRLIELYKHQFKDLHDVIAQIKNRNYKFIIYMDDLSFEDFEIEYKYLKAVIEGGLEKKPDNVLIYATSNRRHLIREKFSDKAELSDDLHENDTVQEKLSLAARFGIQIYFGAPDKKEFCQIVTGLANKHGLSVGKEELLAKANQWELSHGGRSGRTAQQFIDYLLGKGGQE